MTTKKCKGCQKVKSLSEFYPHPNTKDKHQPECKACFAIRSHASWEKEKKRPKPERVGKHKHIFAASCPHICFKCRMAIRYAKTEGKNVPRWAMRYGVAHV